LVTISKISNFKKAVYSGSLLCFGLLFLVSCESKNDPIIARIENQVLRESELNYRIDNGSWDKQNEEQAVESWLRQAAILVHFDSLSIDKQNEINYKIEDYKASLIRYEVENMMIEQMLDTIVTEEEMFKFYELNKKDFELSDFIVKVLYLKIPYNAPDIEKVNRLYLLRQPKDTVQVTEYANKYAANFFYNKEKWLYFDDIMKEIPLDGIDKEKFILNKTKTSFEENGYIYFLNILDYRLKNAPSPFTLEKEHIKQRILTNRISRLRETLGKQLIDKAIEQYEIHYYNRK